MRAGALVLAAACGLLAACGSDRATNGGPETTGSIDPLPAAPSGRITSAPLAAPGGAGAPHVTAPGAALAAPSPEMAGRWTLSSADGRRCGLTFTVPSDAPGNIAPEGGCPGKLYMSRSFVVDPGGALVIRDHTGTPLAQLAQSAPGRFEGRTPDGQQVVLERQGG